MIRNVTDERSANVNLLTEFAFAEITRKYGDGNGNDGERTLTYHNVLHTKAVVQAAVQLAAKAHENGHIEQGGIGLAAIAASFHDIEQDFGSGANEDASAALAAQHMHESACFSSDEVQLVGAMILGTAVSFEKGYVTQHPGDHYLCKLLADADLSSLGQETSQYWFFAEALLRELKQKSQPSDEEYFKFLKSQKTLLENHRFYTDEARELFPHQEENLKLINTKIRFLES